MTSLNGMSVRPMTFEICSEAPHRLRHRLSPNSAVRQPEMALAALPEGCTRKRHDVCLLEHRFGERRRVLAAVHANESEKPRIGRGPVHVRNRPDAAGERFTPL